VICTVSFILFVYEAICVCVGNVIDATVQSGTAALRALFYRVLCV
jgi:hypothetical protein